MFTIRLGLPDMKALWNALVIKSQKGTLSKDEGLFYKKFGKAMALLANNPKHPGLHSHEIDVLTKRYGTKVWQSYLENKTSSAGRLFWVYGPEAGDITVIGIEPHPENRKRMDMIRFAFRQWTKKMVKSGIHASHCTCALPD